MKTRQFRNSAVALVGTGVFLSLLVPSSYGTLYTSGSTSAGGAAVNATADVSISGNTMTVLLTDLQANPGSVGNVLNGITINISGVSGVSGLTANNATTADIASNGSYTPSTTLGTTIASSIGWTVSGSSTIKLSALGTGQPQFLIIGPDKNGNFTDGIGDAGYTGSNSSIDGNGPHNPFILGNETFNFTLSGTGLYNISGVTFLFGTSQDYCGSTPTTPTPTQQSSSPVPEPSTIVAGALLLLPFGVGAIRSLRRDRKG